MHSSPNMAEILSKSQCLREQTLLAMEVELLMAI